MAYMDPICPKCEAPVTRRQQSVGMSTLVDGIGVYHLRCATVELVYVEKAIREAFAEGSAA